MEYHGDEDIRTEPTERQLEVALEEVVECIMDNGQWPKKGRARFDLYDYLNEELDSSYALEMFVATMSSNTQGLENRIERERKHIEKMLLDHLQDSDIVRDHAMEEGE
jgi:hypothetical protein